MEQKEFSDLLLLTAFSVMACDGDIDPKEITLISDFESRESLFKIENLEQRLNELVNEINQDGQGFLRNYFRRLSSSNLSFDEERQLVYVAIKMIEADEIVQYTELRFFKIIHSYLKISGEQILEEFSQVNDIEEYVVQDIISEKYIEKLTSSYFENQAIPEFGEIKIQSND